MRLRIEAMNGSQKIAGMERDYSSVEEFFDTAGEWAEHYQPFQLRVDPRWVELYGQEEMAREELAELQMEAFTFKATEPPVYALTVDEEERMEEITARILEEMSEVEESL